MLQYKALRTPISVQLELTEECTNNCIHCYNHWRIPSAKLSVLNKRKIEQVIQRLVEANVMAVTLTGGEPLINSNLVLYSIKELRKANIDVNLNSNLVLLDFELAKKLKMQGLEMILTSLLSWDSNVHDYLSCRTGAFKKTLEGIKQAIDAGLKVSVNMVLTQMNFSHIYQTAVLAKKLGVKSFSATKASPALNSRDFNELRLSKKQVFESLEILEKIKKEIDIYVDILECYPLCLFEDINRFQHFARRSCSAGKTSCTIGANGLVRPCSHADMTYGNILNEKLSIIWERMLDWRGEIYLHTECKKCKFLAQCSGGCRMEAKYCGNICGKDPYMTSSANITQQLEKKRIPFLNTNQLLFMNKGIRFREENFGYLIYSGKSTLFITTDSYLLLKNIGNDNFAIANLADKMQYSIAELNLFFSVLAEKAMLSIVK